MALNFFLFTVLLDVLTALSDSRQETVEKIHGTENFVGFLYVLGRFPQRDFGLWVFMCTTNVSLFCVCSVTIYIARAITPRLSRLYHHCTATTLVSFPAITPQFLVLFLGYHTRAISLHHTHKSGYHTRRSSYFVVYLSPVITPRVLLHLHHHRGATRTNLLSPFRLIKVICNKYPFTDRTIGYTSKIPPHVACTGKSHQLLPKQRRGRYIQCLLRPSAFIFVFDVRYDNIYIYQIGTAPGVPITILYCCSH